MGSGADSAGGAWVGPVQTAGAPGCHLRGVFRPPGRRALCRQALCSALPQLPPTPVHGAQWQLSGHRWSRCHSQRHRKWALRAGSALPVDPTNGDLGELGLSPFLLCLPHAWSLTAALSAATAIGALPTEFDKCRAPVHTQHRGTAATPREALLSFPDPIPGAGGWGSVQPSRALLGANPTDLRAQPGSSMSWPSSVPNSGTAGK